jgi:hypothetical protein
MNKLLYHVENHNVLDRPEPFRLFVWPTPQPDPQIPRTEGPMDIYNGVVPMWGAQGCVCMPATYHFNRPNNADESEIIYIKARTT